MTDPERRTASYEISLDPESLDREEVVLDSGGEDGLRYRVRLSGNVDDHWRRAYRFIQLNSTGFYRYRLLDDHNEITFNCRLGDSISEVGQIVARLKSFLGLVNRTATSGDFEE